MFKRIFHASVCIAAALLLSSMLAASHAAAVTFTVNSTDDLPDTNPGSGTCHTSANTCTLRAAVMQANRSSGAGATIVLPAGIYNLTIPASVPDGDFNGDLNLTPPPSGSPNAVIAITGAGAATTIIHGNKLDRVFHVYSGRTATISGVTIRNGYRSGVGLDGVGGGILNQGSLTLENAIVTLHASSNGGGGIYSSGTLTLRSTTLSHNGTSTGGGGVYNRGGPLNIINSTIDHNAADSGGGIFNFDSDLVVINSTISLNSVTGDGGGIYNAHNGTANVYNSTIVFNGVDSDRDGGSGGGVYNDPFSPFNLRNSIVAANDVGNTPIYDECTGELNSYGRNLFGADTGCTIKTVTGSWTSLNSFATLGQLQDNGGPTFTVALLAGSNAIDGGDPASGCVDNNSVTLATDQRGQARVVGARCDVGAFEYSAATPPPPSINYQGLWYHAPAESEAGWGINFAHQGDAIFATWFTYDVNGKAWWLTMTANKTATGVYTGQLIRTNGAPFSAFVPPATATVVGTGTLTFTSATTGTFAYSVNDGVNVATQSKAIVLQSFGPVPTCVWGSQPDLSKATKYQDLWWAAGGTESGWGVNLIHQGTTIFATWFTYDSNRNPLWYSVTATQTATRTYTGTLLRTNGPAFNAVPFNPALVGRTSVGTATFTFTSGNAGTFAYAVNDGLNVATQTKAIVRQVFRDPGTVCE